MDARRIGRRAVVAWVGAVVAAGSLGRAALAETVKEGILDGCRKGGHSPVDNRDGSYQCNLKDGGEIRCTTKDECRYVPPPKPGQVASLNGGLGDVLGEYEVVGVDSAVADPLTVPGTVLEATELGISLVVAEPQPERGRGKRRRRR